MEVLGHGRSLTFESNLGQYEDSARFISRGAGYYLALSPAELRVTVKKPGAAPVPGVGATQPFERVEKSFSYRALHITLTGANPNAQMKGEGGVVNRANYFLGNNPSRWRSGVPAFQRVRVESVYPGIDLLHYGNQQQLEYDFEVAPEADPQLIAMQFRGADQLHLRQDTGELIIEMGDVELRQPRPLIYQMIGGHRRLISGDYDLRDATTLGFVIGEYDHKLPLIIDPVVSYSKLFGGSGDDTFWALALDSDGNVYIAGETLSPNLASAGAFQTNLAGVLSGHGDVVVSKLNNQGAFTADGYSTYIGGIADDAALALAVDGAGNAFVTGYTGSTDFPTRFPIQTNIMGTATPFPAPPLDLFVAKINPSGSNLVFSTFYGGSQDELGVGIALDANTNVYVVGRTSSSNFPTANTIWTNLSGGTDGFVLNLDATGTNVLYSRYLGGAGNDFARDVVVNLSGNPVVVGYTSSTNFPVTTNAVQHFLNQTTNLSYVDDAFVSELDAASGALIHSTFLGGTNQDRAIRAAVDPAGAIYVAGLSLSGDFPRTSTNFYTTVVSNSTYADVFVVKLNPTQTNLDYSITFGGSARDQVWDIAVDTLGRASVVGETLSVDFPTSSLNGILGGTNAGGTDAFIAQINSAGNAFTYAALMGSPAEDAGYGVTVDSGGNAYFVGRTASEKFPTKPFTYLPFSDRGAFIVKMLADELPALGISLSGTNANLSWSGLFPELVVQSTTNLLATNAWVDVDVSPVVTNSQNSITLIATNSPQFFRLKW